MKRQVRIERLSRKPPSTTIGQKICNNHDSNSSLRRPIHCKPALVNQGISLGRQSATRDPGGTAEHGRCSTRRMITQCLLGHGTSPGLLSPLRTTRSSKSPGSPTTKQLLSCTKEQHLPRATPMALNFQDDARRKKPPSTNLQIDTVEFLGTKKPKEGEEVVLAPYARSSIHRDTCPDVIDQWKTLWLSRCQSSSRWVVSEESR